MQRLDLSEIGDDERGETALQRPIRRIAAGVAELHHRHRALGRGRLRQRRFARQRLARGEAQLFASDQREAAGEQPRQ